MAIQQTLLQAMITERTCGDACWHAREDICHCSCGGRNHGCLRTNDGEQPARTKRIQGAMYQLIAVETYSETECRAATKHPIYILQRMIDDNAIKAGLFEWHELKGSKSFCDKPLPVYVKTASESEVNRWAELSQWRKGELALMFNKPLTVWIRADLLNLKPSDAELNALMNNN